MAMYRKNPPKSRRRVSGGRYRARAVPRAMPTNAVGKVVKSAVVELLLAQGTAEED